MKRRLIKLIQYLALGAIINIAVASGCAMFSPLYRQQISIRNAEPFGSDTSLSRGVYVIDEQINVRQLMTKSIGLQEEQVIAEPWRYIDGKVNAYRDAEWVSAWGPSDLRRSGLWIWLTCAGWPMKSLQGCHASFRDNSNQYAPPHGGVWTGTKDDPQNHVAKNDRLLPYWPVWPGFAINTIFYAMMLWLYVVAPVALRRRRRIRRGLCPACGYPVGGSAVCTECGAPVRVVVLNEGSDQRAGEGDSELRD